MEAAPQLKAGGLDGGCRILADFGGRMFRPLQRRLRDERNRKSFAAHQPGKASQDGLGISIDRKAAAEWFQKSAEAGNPCSAYALGKLLLEKEQIPQAVHLQSGWPQWEASYILLFLCKKLCFNICDRNVREVGGAFLVHVPVQRVHRARHAGADGAVPVNVAAVPRAVHKAGIHCLRHLP